MKIFCVGRNYVAHAKELNNAVPNKPVIFMKPPSALIKGDRAFYYPDFSEDIHFECELVLCIDKNGKHIQPKFARKYYSKYTLGIDFTARDLQTELKGKGLPWELAKGFDGSAVIGSKWINLGEDESIQKEEFFLHKNGEQVQHGQTQTMLFKVDELISFISSYFTLQQGDLIYTGTPAGVAGVTMGDVLEGFSRGTKLLHCEVK